MAINSVRGGQFGINGDPDISAKFFETIPDEPRTSTRCTEYLAENLTAVYAYYRSDG